MALFNDHEIGLDFNPSDLIWTSDSAYNSGGANVTISTIPANEKRVYLLLGQSNSGSNEIVEYRFQGATNGITFKGDTQSPVIFIYPYVPLGEVVITRPYSNGGRYFWQQAALP